MRVLAASPTEIAWHSGLPVFACKEFLQATGDEFGWIGGVDDSRKLRCILPYTVIRRLGFRVIRFRTDTIPLSEIAAEEERCFLNNVVEHFRQSQADMIIPATNNALFRAYPDGAFAAPYGTFVNDLSKSEDELWGEMHEVCRRNIRKAMKGGVQIKSGKEYLDAAYKLIADTLDRSGVNFRNYDEFRKMVLSLGDNVRIFIAEFQGAVQACVVAPFSMHSGYYWYGGTLAERAKGAMHLLMWQAMLELRALGVKLFNFTGVRIDPEKGSKQEGILTFKMRFGGTLVQGYMWKYSFRPVKFAAYSLAVRLLRGGDIVDLERHKLGSAVAPGSPPC